MMLENEIEEAQRSVKTDAYQMSIGEVINMYRDGELTINPDFQRLFRWEIGQKSKLIESLLLGIPIPSIFVFETEDSKWELIDGLQRISTILEFMGQLKDIETDTISPPSALVGTKYLPSLDNAVWEKSSLIKGVLEADQVPLGNHLKLAIRRNRLSVEILKRPSDNSTKYDLFQRLNAGGTVANVQELRNCIIIMINEEYSKFMLQYVENEHFKSVLSFSDTQIEKQKPMEYLSRFLVHTYIDNNNKLDVEEFIDEGIINLAKKGVKNQTKRTIESTFQLLDAAFGNNALKRYEGGSHKGRVSLAAFECFAVGIAKNLDNILSKENPGEYVKRRIEAFWNTDELDQFFTPGLRGTTRIQRTIPFGDDWFAE